MRIPKEDVCRRGDVVMVVVGWKGGWGLVDLEKGWRRSWVFWGLQDGKKRFQCVTWRLALLLKCWLFFLENKAQPLVWPVAPIPRNSLHDHNRHCIGVLDHCSRWYRLYKIKWVSLYKKRTWYLKHPQKKMVVSVGFDSKSLLKKGVCYTISIHWKSKPCICITV